MSNHLKIQRYLLQRESKKLPPKPCNHRKTNGNSVSFASSKEDELFENSINAREWLTTEEAAEYLRISPKALLNKVSNGTISTYKLGRSNRYRLIELRETLLSQKKGDPT